jgi:hypothetical protein
MGRRIILSILTLLAVACLAISLVAIFSALTLVNF